MPVDTNIQGSIKGISPNLQSVRVWLFDAPVDYPPFAGTPFNPTTPEVAQSQAHFAVFEGFTGKNQGGTSLGRGHLDSNPETIEQYYHALGPNPPARLEAMLQVAFGDE